MARLWKLTEGGPSPPPLTLRGHQGAIASLAFSPDGQWLATAGDDATTRLWNLSAEEPGLAPIVLRERAEVFATRFSSDGRWLATAGNDPSARLWHMRLDDLLGLARQTAGRELSAEERMVFRLEAEDP